MFYVSRFRDRCGYVHDCRQGLDSAYANLRDIVDAILQAEHNCVWRKKRSKLSGSGGIVSGFHAEEHQVGTAGGTQSCRHFNPHSLLELECIEKKTVTANRVNKGFPANHYNRCPRVGQQTTEVPAHTSGAHDSDSWPI